MFFMIDRVALFIGVSLSGFPNVSILENIQRDGNRFKKRKKVEIDNKLRGTGSGFIH